MIDLDSLSERARASEDGEAYVPIARGPGYRAGVGARRRRGKEPDFFLEVVLDPFAERPAVRTDRIAERGALAERLRERGYSLACDDAGVITCERTMDRETLAGEAQAVPRLLRPPRTNPRRRRPEPIDEPS